MRRGQSLSAIEHARPSSVAEASQPIPRAIAQKTKSVRIRSLPRAPRARSEFRRNGNTKLTNLPAARVSGLSAPEKPARNA